MLMVVEDPCDEFIESNMNNEESEVDMEGELISALE